MKSIYAKQLDAEFFDWAAYFNEEDAECRHIAIYGNRDLCGINDFTKHFERDLNDCKYDIDVIREDEYMDEADKPEEIFKTITYYFKKANGEPLTDEEALNLRDLCDDFYACKSTEEDEIIAKVAGIIYSDTFVVTELRGCCQGDWIKMMCPKSELSNYEYIEAVYFGTGTEYVITDHPVEGREEAEEAFENGECYYDYTALWSTEDVKQWIAKEYGSEDVEVKLLTVSDTYTKTFYIYEEE